MSHRFANYHLRNYEAGMASHFNERHGLVTSYDPKTHLSKVTFQPEGEESSWLPIEEGHSGNGWGILVGLTPGTGKGSGQGGAGSSGGNSGGAGSTGGTGGSGTGGTGSSGGSSGQQQYQGDMVSVRYQEGDLETGMIIRRIHNDTDRPPKVEAGEMLMMHSLGARVFFDKKGKFHIYDKTSNQDDQNSQQDGQGGSGDTSSTSGTQRQSGSSGKPLKNAPPLKPQSCHIQFDGKGKMKTTCFQQDKRQQGQDPPDPNSQESPDPFSIHEVDGKGKTHTITTYQDGQGGQQGQQGQQGGGQAQPAKSQGDPGSEAKETKNKKFARVRIDHPKKNLTVDTYQQGSDNPQHNMTMDNQAKKLTVQSYKDGGSDPMHKMEMDVPGGKYKMATYGSGEKASHTLSTDGTLTAKAEKSHDTDSPQINHKGKTNCQGDVNVQGNINCSGIVSASGYQGGHHGGAGGLGGFGGGGGGGGGGSSGGGGSGGGADINILTGSYVLTPNASTTTVQVVGVTTSSKFLGAPTPLTEEAANTAHEFPPPYYTMGTGNFIVTHENNALANRRFAYAILK